MKFTVSCEENSGYADFEIRYGAEVFDGPACPECAAEADQMQKFQEFEILEEQE